MNKIINKIINFKYKYNIFLNFIKFFINIKKNKY